MDPVLESLKAQVESAAAARRPLSIRAGGTKDFYGNPVEGERLDPRAWQGIEAYEPTELVVTARCGTPLAELESLLAGQGQMLAFEPPHFGPDSTVGGCVAAGLAGPGRIASGFRHGAVRDFVLGARLLDGRGQLLRFGGTVMKNVAGYDVSRALAGSLGILGVIVDVSLKVVPVPEQQCTLRFELDELAALDRLAGWAALPLPVSANAWSAGELRVRLSGSSPALGAARARLGGEPLPDGEARAFWTALRDQRLEWFAGDLPLWRIALPAGAPPLGHEPTLIEWGGMQRWIRSGRTATDIREQVGAMGGHATLMRGGDRTAGAFQPLAAPMLAIHRRLKQQFDPAGVLNPGRLVAGL